MKFRLTQNRLKMRLILRQMSFISQLGMTSLACQRLHFKSSMEIFTGRQWGNLTPDPFAIIMTLFKVLFDNITPLPMPTSFPGILLKLS